MSWGERFNAGSFFCGATYTSTKGALNTLTKNVAMRLIDTNIRCNAVAPDSTITPAHLVNMLFAKEVNLMKMRLSVWLISSLMFALLLTGCGNSEEEPVQPETLEGEPVQQETAEKGESEEDETMKMNVTVGENTFTATLADNKAVDALVEMMESEPVVIQMSDYAGFEKVGSLGRSLPTSNSQTTTQSGDIVLYNGNQIVIFYDSNSWSYTRLGKIDDLTGWEEALGSNDVIVTFSIGE